MRSEFVAILLVGVVVLTPTAASATFAGANGTVVITAARPSDAPRGLFAIRRDGTTRRLLPKRAWEDIAAAWSPDGTTLAFTSDRTGQRDIWSFEPARDGSLVRLTSTPNVGEWLPTWGPDGRLAFVCERPGRDSVDVLDPATGERSTVARARRFFGVEWSPDGRTIVFGRTLPGGAGIVAIRPDGSDPRRWVTGLARAVVYDWRPDRRRVLFQTIRDGRPVLSEIRTGGRHHITRLTAPTRSEGDQHGVYAPDASRVLFVRTTIAGDELWMVRTDGTRAHRFRAYHRARVYGTTWQPR